jgi:hypothetical protein
VKAVPGRRIRLIRFSSDLTAVVYAQVSNLIRFLPTDPHTAVAVAFALGRSAHSQRHYRESRTD